MILIAENSEEKKKEMWWLFVFLQGIDEEFPFISGHGLRTEIRTL